MAVTEQSTFTLSALHAVSCPITSVSESDVQQHNTAADSHLVNHKYMEPLTVYLETNISVKCLASHLTDLKRFLLLMIMFKSQNKTSVLSVTTDSYLGKMTPGPTAKGCSS